MNYPTTLTLDSHLVLHWTARVLSLLSIGIILLFFIGEGFNPARVTAGEWALMLCFPLSVMIGMLVAWRHEALGGLIAMGGLLGFYLVHAALAQGHLPRGWAYVVFASPGFLFLLSALWLRVTRR
jgi:hypothetical protein